jgi:hypothetical protein
VTDVNRGTTNGNSKLTEQDVRQIKIRYGELKSYRKVGKEFGVSHESVALIIRGNTWSHVDPGGQSYYIGKTPIDLTGQRFGNWTVLKRAETKRYRSWWTCKCDCGLVKDVSQSSLRRRETRGCKSCYAERLRSAAKAKRELDLGEATFAQTVRINTHAHLD